MLPIRSWYVSVRIFVTINEQETISLGFSIPFNGFDRISFYAILENSMIPVIGIARHCQSNIIKRIMQLRYYYVKQIDRNRKTIVRLFLNYSSFLEKKHNDRRNDEFSILHRYTYIYTFSSIKGTKFKKLQIRDIILLDLRASPMTRNVSYLSHSDCPRE